MIRKRRPSEQHAHHCLLVNTQAANYNPIVIKRLMTSIRRKGGAYTIHESDSAAVLVERAQLDCGLRRRFRRLPPYMQRRGKVTSIVACGGDGTFNLAAGVALAADLPVGVVPMGRFNNIARSLYDSVEAEPAIQKIVKRGYQWIDTATVSGRFVIGSFGIGFIPQIARLLEGRKTPKFGFRWSQLGAKAASTVPRKKMIIKVDSFRFEVRPTIFNINLLPYSAGLPLSPASIFDDRQIEVVFDVGDNTEHLSSFVRLIYKRKYAYGSDVRLFRGKTISFQPIKRQVAYLDGELINLQSNIVEVNVGEKQLKVFC